MPLSEAHSPPEAEMVRLGPLCCLPALLREFGVEPGPLFARFGLAEAVFLDPDFQISIVMRASMLAACARESTCPHLGLMLGQRSRVPGLGLIGQLLHTAPDVGTALDEFVTHFHLQTASALVSLHVGEQVSSIAYEPAHAAAEGMELVHDGAMAVMWSILSALCGPKWRPREVRLRRRRPESVEPYRRFFRAPLFFDAEQSAIVFDTSWLNKKISSADLRLHTQLVKQVEALSARIREDIVQRARHALVLMLGSRPCTLPGLAEALSLHPRTLNRRLRDAGTTFRQLHQEARHHRARQLLQGTDNSIVAIAEILGYASANAFTRAFLEWEGTPPATWRRSVSQGDAK